MTTSTSSEAQKNDGWKYGQVHKESKNKNQKTFFSHIFNTFIFCSITDRPTDKVNYILNAHWYTVFLEPLS